MSEKKYIITGISHGWSPEVTAVCLDADKADKKGELWQRKCLLEDKIDKLNESIAKLSKAGTDRMTEEEQKGLIELIKNRVALERELNLVWEEYDKIRSRDPKDSVTVKKNVRKARVGQVYTADMFQKEFRN